MGKRSRDTSFSPVADETPSSTDPSSPAAEADPLPPPKHPTLVAVQAPAPMMQCTLPPHREPRSFSSIEAFEVHYAKEHTHRCTACSKNFPTAHFLSLHIEEHHDPFRSEREAKGEKTYGCFVEGCDKLCSSAQKRRLHLVDKHMFPKTYHFRVVEHGIDRSTSMLKEKPGHRRRISTAAEPRETRGTWRRSSATVGSSSANSELTPASSPEQAVDERTAVTTKRAEKDTPDAVGELEKSMAALRFVPPSVLARQKKKKG